MERLSIPSSGTFDDRNLNILGNGSLPETSTVLTSPDQRGDDEGGQPEGVSPKPISFVDLTAIDASLLVTTSDSRLFKDGYESVAGVGSGTRLNARKKIAAALSEHINEIPGVTDAEYILTVQDLFLTQVVQRRNELLPEDKIMQRKNGFVGRLLGRAEEGISQPRIAMDIVKEEDGQIMLGEDGEKIVQKIADELYLRAEGLSLATGDTECYGVIADDLQQFVDSAINKKTTLPRELVVVYNAVRIAYENKVYELQLKEELVTPSETVPDANDVDILDAVQEVGLQVTNLNSLSEDLKTELTLLDQADPSILIGIQSLSQNEQAERRQEYADAMTRLKDYAVSKLKSDQDNSDEQPEVMLNRLAEERIVKELRLENTNLVNVSDEEIIKDIKASYHQHDSENPKLDSKGSPVSSYDQYLRVIKNDIINERIDEIVQNANRQLITIRTDEEERNVPLSERTVITARESAERYASQNLDLVKQAEIYESQKRPEKPWVTKLKSSKLAKNLKLIANSAGVKDGSSGAVMGARIVGLVMTFAGVAGAISEMRSQDMDEDNHDFNPYDSLADYESYHHVAWYEQTGDVDVDEVHSNVMSELVQRWGDDNTTDDIDVLTPLQQNDALSDNALDDDITTSSVHRGGRIAGGLASMAMTEDELLQLAELEEQPMPQADFETGEPENSTEIPPQKYTVTVDGTGQSFNLDPNLVVTVLEQFGVDDDVLNGEIPDGMTLNVGGMTLRINSEAADATAQQDNPDFETTFNPAALASLLGNETLTDLAEDIADRATDVVEDFVAKMGVEQVFEEVVEEVSKYESLARALGEKGVELAEQAPNTDLKVELNTGSLKAFGELLKHGVLTNVNGVDWNGLQNVGEEITVVLHDGNIGTFTNAHEAIRALYDTITNLLPDDFEITIEGDEDVVLGKNRDVAPEVLVKVFTDPEKLEELQGELEDKGINIFNLVGLNQTEEGKIEIPQETIDTVKAIVGGVAEAVTGGHEEPAPEVIQQEVQPQPVEVVVGEPVTEEGITNEQSVPAEESPVVNADDTLVESSPEELPDVDGGTVTDESQQAEEPQGEVEVVEQQEATVEAQPEQFILRLTINGDEYNYKINPSALLDTLEQIGIREETEKAYIPDSLDFRIGDIYFHIASDTAEQASLQDAPDFETTFNPKALEPLLNSPALEIAGNGLLEVVLETIGDQAAKWGLEKQWEEALEVGEAYAPLIRALVELGVEIAPDEDIKIELNTGDLKPFGELLKHGIKANVEGDIVGELEKAGEQITISLADGQVGTYTDSHGAITALYNAVMEWLPDDFELTIEGTDGSILLKQGEAVDPGLLVKIFSDPQYLNLIQEELEKQGINIFKLVGLVETADGGYALPEGAEEVIIQVAKSAVDVVEGLQQPGGNPAPEVIPQEEQPQPVEVEVGEPVTEEGITNEQSVPAEESPIQADSQPVAPTESTNTVFAPGVFAQGDGAEVTNEQDQQIEQKPVNVETKHWTTPISELDDVQLKQRMEDVEQTLNNVRAANEEERGNLHERQTINVDSIDGLTREEIERFKEINPELVKTYEGDVAKLLAEEFGINPSVAKQVAAVVENAPTVEIINRVLELETPENVVEEEALPQEEIEAPTAETTTSEQAVEATSDAEAEVVEEVVENEVPTAENTTSEQAVEATPEVEGGAVEVEEIVETQTTPPLPFENEAIDKEPIIKSFKVSSGGSLSKILNDAGLMTNDLYGEDGAIEQLEANSIAVIDGKAYILVNDDPSTTAKVFNVINPRSDMQGTPEGARLIVLELPENVSTDTDSLIDNILNPVRNVLRNQELTIGDGQTLDDAFDTVLESVNREVHNLPEEATVENSADTTPATPTNTTNIPFVATPGETQTQEFVDTASNHWQSRIEELDSDQLEQRISDSQTTLNNVRLATEQEKDTLHERQIINVYSARMLSEQQIAQLGDITPELVAQYEGDIAELLTTEFGMNGSIAKQVAAVIENAPTVEIINRVLELNGIETAQAPVEAPEIPVEATQQPFDEAPVVVEPAPAEETVEQIPTEVAETAAEVPPFVLPELPEETVTETPEQAEEPQEGLEEEAEVEQPEVAPETVETPEAPLAETGVVEEELKFPEFMQITFNINGIEQTYRIETAQISEILQNVGYENEVLEAYIPDNITGSIAGIDFTISSEGADSNANTPVIDSSFNPAAIAALTGNQDLVDAAEGIYQKILDIVGDQASKMGLENAFETAMTEAGKYESLAKALVALGIENAPNEDVKINIDAGPLAPFGRLIQEGIQANVNGDFSGLEAAGQEITVLLQDGSIGTFVNSHVAVDELYNTITSLLPDGYELVIEGENGDIVLGKGHDIPAEVLVQVLSDPKYLNLIQQELENKGINIFNLVGLNQTEEGKIEIPQETIDTFKAIVGGVAGAVTAGAEALDEADNSVQPEDGGPVDTDVEVPQTETEQPLPTVEDTSDTEGVQEEEQTTGEQPEPIEETPQEPEAEQPLSAGEATFPTEGEQEEALPGDEDTAEEVEAIAETESAETPVEYQEVIGGEGSQGKYEWRTKYFEAPSGDGIDRFYTVIVDDVTDNNNTSDFKIIFRAPSANDPDGSIQITYQYGDYIQGGEVVVYTGPIDAFKSEPGKDLTTLFDPMTIESGLTEDTQALIENYNEGIEKAISLVTEARNLFEYIQNFSDGSESSLTPPSSDSESEGDQGQPTGTPNDRVDEENLPDEETNTEGMNENNELQTENRHPRVDELSNSAGEDVKNFVIDSMQSGDRGQISSAINTVAEMNNPDPEMVGSVLDYFVNNKGVFINPDYSNFGTILQIMKSNEDHSFNVNGRVIIISDEINELKSDLSFEKILGLHYQQQDRGVLLHEIFPDENTGEFLRQILDNHAISISVRHHAIQVLAEIGEAEIEDFREHYEEVRKIETPFTYSTSQYLQDLIEISPELNIDMGEEAVSNLEVLAQNEKDNPISNAMRYEDVEVPSSGIPYELSENHIGRLLYIVNSEDYSVMAKHNAVGILINSDSQLSEDVVDDIVGFINSQDIGPETNTIHVERYIRGLMNKLTQESRVDVVEQLLEGQTQNSYLTSMLLLYKTNNAATPETIDNFVKAYNALEDYEKSNILWELIRIPEVDRGLTDFIYSQLQYEGNTEDNHNDPSLNIRTSALILIQSGQVELTEDGMTRIQEMALNDDWLNGRLAALRVWHNRIADTGVADEGFINAFKELIRDADADNNGYFDMYGESYMDDEIEQFLLDPVLMETLLEMIEEEDLGYDKKLWDPVILHMQKILLESENAEGVSAPTGTTESTPEEGDTSSSGPSRTSTVNNTGVRAETRNVGVDSPAVNDAFIESSSDVLSSEELQAAQTEMEEKRQAADGLVSNEEWSRTVEDAFMNSTYKPERRTLSEEWKEFVVKFEDFVAEVTPEIKLTVENVATYFQENPINGNSIRNIGLSLSGLLLGTVMTRFNKGRRRKDAGQRPVRVTQQQKWIDNFEIKNTSDKIDMVLGSAGILEESPYGVQKNALVFNPYNGTTEKVRLNGTVKTKTGFITVSPEQEVKLHSIFSGGYIPRSGVINVTDNSMRLIPTLNDIEDYLKPDKRDELEEIVSEAITSGIIDSQLPQDIKDELNDVITSSQGETTPTGLFSALVKRITDLLLENKFKIEIGELDGMPEDLKIQVLKLMKV